MDDRLARRALPPLDRLPAEIRVDIFGLVLCPHGKTTFKRMPELDEDDLTPDEYLAKRSWVSSVVRGLELIRADTALLVALANDAHYGEACEVFYAGNVFHLNTHGQLDGNGRQSALFVTNLELVNFAYATEFLNEDLVAIATGLPNLKRCSSRSMGSRVPRLGYYELDFGDGKIIYFRHYSMVKSWRMMNRDCTEHQGRSAWDIVSADTPICNQSPHAWATAFDLLTWGKSKLVLNDAYDTMQRQFLRQYKEHLIMRKSTRTVILAVSRGCSFMDLAKHKSCTAKILEGITDLLLANGVGWAGPVLGHKDYDYWAEQHKHRWWVETLRWRAENSGGTKRQSEA
ncbi:hypothetical protein LTR17_013501 [Elasticomyces elasticus]|nr:hypothetical protein LTR17_013501 [Elasticomyces elasticus]